MKQIVLILAAAGGLANSGCSPDPDRTPPSAFEGPATASPGASTGPALTIGGLDRLRIGQEVPAQSGWEVGRETAGGGCATARSKDYPGIYAIVEDSKVRRITVGEGSKITLAEGIGVGSEESKVKASFPSFREEPHKYEDAPAKYIGSPDVKPGSLGWRFEINSAGKVSRIHVGQMPVLAYVEGCG